MEDLILKNIKERRSIRKFASTMVKKEDIEKIVEAGLFAASGKSMQASKIIVISNKEMRNQIAEMNRKIMGAPEGFDPFYGAPVVLLVVAEASAPTGIYDGSLTLGNMMLEVESLGLSSIWIHRAKEEVESDEGKALLKKAGLKGDYVGIGHLAIGYADCEKPAAAPRKADRVFYID